MLAHPETHHPFIDSDLFERIGGALTISALIASLYDGIESDPMLRPLFGRDLALERESQQRFSTGWFGGEREYTNRAYLALEHRHDLLPITRAGARARRNDFAHFSRAPDLTVSDPHAMIWIPRLARAP